MKRVLILLLFALPSVDIKAQTFTEWFRQSATQKKYLLKQIAALQVYIGYVRKGYAIANGGLTAISDIKESELYLHNDYFNSLKAVNPKIKNYSNVADLIRLQVKLITTYKEAIKHVNHSQSFNAGEIRYVNGFFERLLDDCFKTIDVLLTVTTSGKLEMKDDERLERIDALYADIQEKYTFVQAFAGEAKLLAASRTQERNDLKIIRAFNGIKY